MNMHRHRHTHAHTCTRDIPCHLHHLHPKQQCLGLHCVIAVHGALWGKQCHAAVHVGVGSSIAREEGLLLVQPVSTEQNFLRERLESSAVFLCLYQRGGEAFVKNNLDLHFSIAVIAIVVVVVVVVIIIIVVVVVVITLPPAPPPHYHYHLIVTSTFIIIVITITIIIIIIIIII